MIINILCPTRGRPNLARQMYESVRRTAKDLSKIRIWFYISDDEPKRVEYDLALPLFPDEIRFIYGPDAPTAYMWNKLAKEAYDEGGDLFFLMGDDVLFETEGWDERYRMVARDFADGIYCIAPNDGRGSGVPHPCVNRAWIETLGYFVNPVFLHWGVDSYTEKLAKKLDRFVYLSDVSIKHAKVGEAHAPDETYNRLRRGVWHERDRSVMELMDRYIGCDTQRLLRVIMADGMVH